jgi:hypothetical protein
MSGSSVGAASASSCIPHPPFTGYAAQSLSMLCANPPTRIPSVFPGARIHGKCPGHTDGPLLDGDGGDGNDNGTTQKDDQEANMTPQQGPMQNMVWAHAIMAPRAGRAGATVGATSQSSPTRRRSAAGAKVPQHRMPRPSRRGVPEHTWGAALHSMQMHEHPSSSSSSTARRSSRATSTTRR